MGHRHLAIGSWLARYWEVVLLGGALAVVLATVVLWRLGAIGGQPRPNWLATVGPGARWCFVMDGKPLVCRQIEEGDISITAEERHGDN